MLTALPYKRPAASTVSKKAVTCSSSKCNLILGCKQAKFHRSRWKAFDNSTGQNLLLQEKFGQVIEKLCCSAAHTSNATPHMGSSHRGPFAHAI